MSRARWSGWTCATPTIGSCELADELGFDQNAVEDVCRPQRTDQATRYATHTFLTVYATALGPQVANDLESRLLTARVSIFVLHGAEGSGW